MSLTPAERFARYMHKPPSWPSPEGLADSHTDYAARYRQTTEWTDRNRHAWPRWFDVLSPRQQRRLMKKMRGTGVAA
mgnify:CR=1 FL=1